MSCRDYADGAEHDLDAELRKQREATLKTTTDEVPWHRRPSRSAKAWEARRFSTNKCSALDQKACATVDKHGGIRVACIDKVAN